MCFWRGHSLCRAPLTTGVDIYPRVLPSACCVLLAGPLPLQGALNHWGRYLPQGPTICILCASGTHTHTYRHWTLPTTMSVLETPLQGPLNHWGRILPQGPTIQNNQLKKRVCVKILDFDPWPSSPPPLAWTLGSGIMKWKLTLQGTYGQVLMLYDIWLSIYRLLKNITAEILYYGQVLDFDLWPHPLAWTLRSVVMD